MKRLASATLFALFALPAMAQSEAPALSTSSVDISRYALSINRASILQPTRQLGYPIWQRGKLSLHPNFNYSYNWAENIASKNASFADTSIHTLSLNASLSIGDNMSLSYSPSWVKYQNPEFNDHVAQSANFQGNWAYQTWSGSLQQSYQSSQQTGFETLRQTSQKSWTTGLSLSHELSRPLSVSLDLNHSLSNSDLNTKTQRWRGQAWLSYTVTPFLQLGAGPGVGYTKIENGTNARNADANVRASWRLSRKLSASGALGRSSQSYSKAGSQTQDSTTYSASIVHTPFEATQLSLSAQRGVQPSLLQGQLNQSRSWSAGLNQRLLGFAQFTLGYSQSTSAYQLVNTQTREDTAKSLSLGLSMPLTRMGTFSLFHEKTSNNSDRAGFSRNIYSTGFSLGFHF